MYACLYTKQKTQKRKVWQDGRLVVRGSVAHLHRADPIVGGGDPQLDACEVAPHVGQLAPGLLLEMESHLVTVDGPWTGSASAASSGGALAMPATTAAPVVVPAKVLPKFRKPPARPPPPPQPPSNMPPQLMSRKRPLQPGELQQQYYGAREAGAIYNVDLGHSTHPPHLGGTPLESRAPWGSTTQSQPTVSIPPRPASQEAFEHPRSRQAPTPHEPLPQHRPHPPVQPPPPPPPTSFHQRAAPFDPSHRRRSAPPTPNNLASHDFATNNGFDPSRFYGDEEEEEEEDDEGGLGGGEHDVVTGSEAPKAKSWLGRDGSTSIVAPNQPVPQSDAYQRENPMPVARSDEAVSFNSTLSEEQLLDLFGVDPPTSAPSVVSIPPASSPRDEEPGDASTFVPSSSTVHSLNAQTSLKSLVDAADFTLPDDDDDDDALSSSSD